MGGSPDPNPGGGVEGSDWRVSRPTLRGVSRPTSGGGGCPGPGPGGPRKWLLLQAVRILLECILVKYYFPVRSRPDNFEHFRINCTESYWWIGGAVQNFLNFIQIFGKFGKIVCWRPPGGLVPPPTGNPGSTTESQMPKRGICVSPSVL